MAITEEQRQARRRYLGSSDSPVIMNLSPYSRTPSDIYWSKVADLPYEETTAAMDTGNWLEGPLIQWAASELDLSVDTDPCNLFHVAQHGDGSKLLASNLDAIAWDEKAAIEAKFANGDMAKAYGEPGTDQVADHVIIQVQHQMYCADLEKAYVALAVPSYYGVDRRLYCVPRDDELIETIVAFGCLWWTEHVECKHPPDEHQVPPMYVLKALERRSGTQIKLNQEHIVLADDDERLRLQIKALTGEREDIRRRLIHALGEAEIGLLPDGRKVEYKASERSYFDQARLKAEKPEIAAIYTQRRTSRTLYVKKGR